MKKLYWVSGCGNLELKITKEDAETGYHSGQCSDSIAYLLTKDYIKKQFDKLTVAEMRNYLKDYDLERPKTKYGLCSQVLWLACGDLQEDYNYN